MEQCTAETKISDTWKIDKKYRLQTHIVGNNMVVIGRIPTGWNASVCWSGFHQDNWFYTKLLSTSQKLAFCFFFVHFSDFWSSKDHINKHAFWKKKASRKKLILRTQLVLTPHKMWIGSIRSCYEYISNKMPWHSNRNTGQDNIPKIYNKNIDFFDLLFHWLHNEVFILPKHLVFTPAADFGDYLIEVQCHILFEL